MAETRIVSTSAGPVEIVQVPGERPPVLFFPGGHCSAKCDCGWGLYTGSGHAVVSFSRPGYGGTRVGPLSAAEFEPLISEVCEQLDITVIAAAVGVARALFRCMRSDSGFINDLRQGQDRWAAARRDVLSKVQCPTLVTGSPHDRGVSFAHAEDFANAIPDAQLVGLDSPSHIFWIGPGRARLVSIVRSFIDE
ncbi:MAG: hypothetical protein ABI903_05535 [Actinomycetota bacterium]